ncbi:MAG TPA: hypothetical protein DDY14_16055 [Chromatiaceae bacterium]|jgi:hypothetical protein|nr:MAG: hypothetical protein N838_14730 [Thiohalocapsa sp. PB-PSB1]QQO53262.1 MAG: hypothetical protein N838_07680 [Thiohalocapsa sp. PB-PSB1]HBG96796.1 hypothetical protein [Chromatiaceae bacterium]HCS91473.1 hypothetical protein [Chromatiaceae bacterium]
MNKRTTAALVITAFALTPLAAFANVGLEEIEDYCQQKAMEEEVAEEDLLEYIEDCAAENMKAEEELEAEKTAEEEAE